MTGPSQVLAGEFAGRYAVERELGHGATSVVHLARDLTVGRLVAIKVLRQEFAQLVSSERFLREARLTAKLDHPHIVPLYDVGECEAGLYCVLRYMEGGTLRARLARERQLPVDVTLTIGIAVARALAYAHERNVIHRDVKPENILFGADGVVRLADFGLARAIDRSTNDESSTSEGIVRGTPAYMSPEQASGDRDFDGRSDIYSLGCVLYEMLAGVAAFVGPSPQSLLAQRMSHMPRPVRVYRPETPPIVERTLERALAILPADRFQSAAAFADALERARDVLAAGGGDADVTDDEALPQRRQRRRVATAAVLVGFAVVIAGAAAAVLQPWRPPALDTTRIVVLPFDAPPTPRGALAPHEMLQAALRRWRDLTVVSPEETMEALRRRVGSGPPSPEQARAVARSLGASRFVLGQLVRTPTGPALVAAYRDVRAGVLHVTQLPLPGDSSRIAGVYAALGDSLVLRGASTGDSSTDPTRPRRLFATQALIAGLTARDEWDLARADTLFGRAAELDPSLARARLWLAQVRSWQGEPVERWVASARRALLDSAALAPQERRLAAALLALASRDFPAACGAYRATVAADPRSFTGWFGLGQCQASDRVVVPDRRSPSGWRFRSSYQRAVDAYVTAFQLLPATYQGFNAGGYLRLRELLRTSGRVFQAGHSETVPRRSFLAMPTVAGDTIVLVPHDQDSVFSGRVAVAASPEAIRRQRLAFQQVAFAWAGAFPTSASAKEAAAIALELEEDPAAADTMRAALRLARNPSQRLRLTTASVLLDVKFAIPADTARLRAARQRMDSLLRAHAAGADAEAAALLAPLAALTGRCALAARLIRLTAAEEEAAGARIPADVMGDALALQARTQMGCTAPKDAVGPDALAARIPTFAPSAARATVEYMLLGAAIQAGLPAESAWVRRLAPTGGFLFAAATDLLDGHRDAAAARLRAIARGRRDALPGEFTPDAALPEARLWARLGDTTAALRVLDVSLSAVRGYDPVVPSAGAVNVALTAGLVRAMAARARLAPARDPGAAARWGAAAAVLLQDADPEIRAQLSSSPPTG